MTTVNVGDILQSKYCVERVLGHGGMGVVVAARHLELGELYALKFLLPAGLTAPGARERFLREARASARLRSEHVARVHDVGQLDKGAPFMVMEYLDGCDLKNVLHQQGPLPYADAVLYMLQACEAIGEAHELGIVHRDLKLANLFLTRRRNGTPCVKVLDFGISKPMSADEKDLTQTGVALGSPLYMSPEQIMQTQILDHRTDIWSLGIVLYELLTGTTPFNASTLMAVAGRILQEEPTPPSQFGMPVPKTLDAVVSRCLHKCREDRFQSVDELVRALRDIHVPPRMAATGGSTDSISSDIFNPKRDVIPELTGSTVQEDALGLPTPARTDLAVIPTEPNELAAMTGTAWGGTGMVRDALRRRKAIAGLFVIPIVAAVAASVWLFTHGWSEPATSITAPSVPISVEQSHPATAQSEVPTVTPSSPMPSSNAVAAPLRMDVVPTIKSASVSQTKSASSIPTARAAPTPRVPAKEPLKARSHLHVNDD